MRYSQSLMTHRPALLSLILSAATCFLFLATCNDDGGTGPQPVGPSAQLISRSSCKESLVQPTFAASECSQDCLEYWSDSTGNLHVKHINAGFNCCIDSVAVTVEIRGQVAYLTETEIMRNGCHCLCLYDIEYELLNLPSTVTKIEIAEPYADPAQWPDEKPLCCSFTLPVTDTGSCCVDRCHYPWGISAPPDIIVISQSGCKGSLASAVDSLFECVEWNLFADPMSFTLDLKHTNAFANCCLDSITATMEMRGDTIEIIEQQWVPMPCDCLCRYDVNMVLRNIEPGSYVIAIRYGVWDEGYPKVAFRVNLLENPTGQHCEPR